MRKGNSQQWMGLSQAQILRLELGGDDEIAVKTELIDVSEKKTSLPFFTDWETDA